MTTTSDKSDNQNQVSRAHIPISNAPNLISTFNQIWPYLQHNQWQESETLIGFIQRDCGTSSKISELPTICGFCASTLKSVTTLLKQLETQIRKLGKIIQESKAGGQYSYRAQNFQQAIRTSNLLPEEIEATLEFLRIECVDIKDLEEDLPLSPEGDEVDHFENEDESDSDYIKSEDEDSYSTSSSDETDAEDEKPEVASSPIAGQKGIPIGISDDSVICSICGKKFCNKYAVDGHKRSSHELNIVRKPPTNDDFIEKTGYASFIMDGCGKTFTEMYLARNHQKRVHRLNADPSLVCDLCGIQKRTKSELLLHKESHEKNRRRWPGGKCDLCKAELFKDKLLEHVRNHVGDEYVIKCPKSTCYYASAQPSSMRKHLGRQINSVHSLPNDRLRMGPICEVCGFKASYVTNLISHLNENHETATKNYACPVSRCEQRYTVKQSVVLHLPYHDFSTGLTSQRCDLCSVEIKVEKMDEHLKDMHQVSEIIKCDQCSFLFSSREQLLEHLYKHRFGELQCDMCKDGVKFSRHGTLRDHYFVVHKIGVKFSCECVFWRKGNLTEHMMIKHPRVESGDIPGKKKVFRCEECSVEYKMEISLKEHNIRCHGAEPFSCKFCSETFIQRNSLNKHVRKHRGVTAQPKKFKCEVEGCGEIFKENRLLKRHHEVEHLGIRPVCDLCGKSFTQSAGFQLHKSSVHLNLRPFVGKALKLDLA